MVDESSTRDGGEPAPAIAAAPVVVGVDERPLEVERQRSGVDEQQGGSRNSRSRRCTCFRRCCGCCYSERIDDEEKPEPENVAQSCFRRCFDVHNSLATPEELKAVLNALRPGELLLGQDVIVSGELVHRSARLVSAGWRYPHIRKDLLWWEVNDVRDYIRKHIEEHRSLRVVFKVARAPFPWCVILRCPCCLYMLVVLATVAFIGLGLFSSEEFLTINTNFDSFTESDGPASNNWNAILAAVSANAATGRDEDMRRLSSKPSSNLWDWMVSSVETRGSRQLRQAHELHRSGVSRKLQDARAQDNRDFSYADEHPERGGPLYKPFRLQITYVAVNDSVNILSPAALEEAHEIEQRVRNLDSFKEMCMQGDPPFVYLCEHGTSFLNFVYPSRQPRNDGGTDLVFNGTGEIPLPIEVAAEFAIAGGNAEFSMPLVATEGSAQLVIDDEQCVDKTHRCHDFKFQGHCQRFSRYEVYMQDACSRSCGFCGTGELDETISEEEEMPDYLPPANGSDSNSGGTLGSSRVSSSAKSANESKYVRIEAIKTEFYLKKLCCYKLDSNKTRALAYVTELFQQVVSDCLDLEAASQRDKGNHLIYVFFDGDNFETTAVMRTVQGDLMWGVVSYAFVFFYATIHTRSLLLATGGLILVMLSIPAAVSVFILVSGSSDISLMMLLSIFIIIGVGSDMLFVYTDFWKQSVHLSRNPVMRLKFTYKQAASSTAATTFTTCMSFMANLASSLRPLREFGFFMGCCVVIAWLLMFIAYPPMLIVGERIHRSARTIIVQSTAHGMEDNEEDGGSLARSGSRQSVRERASQRAKSMKRSSQNMLVQWLDPEKKGAMLQHTFFGTKVARLIHVHKMLIIVAFTTLVFVMLWTAGSSFELSGDVPEVYPDDHHRKISQQYVNIFNPVDLDKARETNYQVTRCGGPFNSCEMQECTTSGKRLGSRSRCQCFAWSEQPTDCLPSRVAVRLIGQPDLRKAMYSHENHLAFLQRRFPRNQVSVGGSDPSFTQMVTFHWETGAESVSRIMQVSPGNVLNKSNDQTFCTDFESQEVQDVCYCDKAPCLGGPERMVSTGHLDLDLESDTVDQGRRLQTSEGPGSGSPTGLLSSVRPDDRADVLILWGMQVIGTQPKLGVSKEQPYRITGDFSLVNPWAQRTVLNICEEWPEDMKVVTQFCWLLSFKTYWELKGGVYPVREHEDLDAYLYEFSISERIGTRPMAEFMWFDSEQKMVAMFLQAYMGVGFSAAHSQALDMFKVWDSYWTKFNQVNKDTAWGGVLHGSRLWVQAEAQDTIISSTMNTLAISLGCVLLGVCIFTHSLHLALIVMTMVLTVIISLFFFMVDIMKLAVGPIEVLSLIVFVGFAVDYCLHVAHKYHSCTVGQVKEDLALTDDYYDTDSDTTESSSIQPAEPKAFLRKDFSVLSMQSKSMTSTDSKKSIGRRVSIVITESGDKAEPLDPEMQKLLETNRPEERFERTRYALERMGSAVMGSALTTIGSAVFLLPCTLVIFTKIGAVVLAVTISAIAFTMVPLPAILMAIGPCSKDISSFAEFVTRISVKGKNWWFGEEAPNKNVDKGGSMDSSSNRYVLNLPARRMGDCGNVAPPSRTKINASGNAAVAENQRQSSRDGN